MTDTIFVSNLHCSSCVATVTETLALLSPAPADVSVSIVAQTVTFRRPQGLSVDRVKTALDHAGFDVEQQDARPIAPPLRKRQKHEAQCRLCQETLRASGSSFDSADNEKLHDALHVPSSSDPTSSLCVSLAIGGMTCASCVNTVSAALADVDGVSDVAIDLIGHSGAMTVVSRDVVDKAVEAIEDCGYTAEVITVRPLQQHQPQTHQRNAPGASTALRVSLSVGGMTCASCSNTITDALSKLEGVSDVHVDLIGNSASLLVGSQALLRTILKTIDDIGYEAEVVSEEPIDAKRAESGPRTVALRVEGMYCSHCPPRVMASLQRYIDEGKLTIVKPLTAGLDPIIEVSYTPSSPYFTIRDIISTISHAKDSPSDSTFNVSTYKPPTLEERSRAMHAREQRNLLLRLAFSVVTAIPTFIIGIVYMSLVPKSDRTRMWFMSPMWAGNASRVEWALFFLSTPVYFYSAGLFHRRALKELRALWRPSSKVPIWKRFIRFGSMNLLISAGTSVAYFASIALLALAASQPRHMMGEGDVTTYFDSVVFLTMFLLIGRFMEAYSKGRTADAITALGKLRPSTALLVAPVDALDVSSTPHREESVERDVEKASAGAEHLTAGKGMKVQTISTDLLEIGDVVRVLAGSTPPADGTITSLTGAEVQATFDESSLTGESKPVKKASGDQVFLGTINRGNVVDVRVDAVGGESMLDHIVSVVREGQTKRAPIERVADHITAYFVPVVTLLAIATWVIWLGLGLGGVLPGDYLDADVGGWPVWSLEFAIAVFVVACPCGIGLAAPTALLVGSGLAARFGILARGGGEAFQETAQLDLLAFDKTGTVTEGGEPQVTDIDVAADSALSREQILGMVLEMENTSGHPLALALQRFTREHGAVPQEASAHEETPGRGLSAAFASLGYKAVIGNEAWMAAHGAELGGRLANILEAWKTQGKSVVLVALASHRKEDGDYKIVASFAIADPVRPEAAPVLAKLQDQGISVWMISGDNEVTAKAVAKMVGIPSTNVIAGVLPHEKADKVRWLQQVGQKRPVGGLRRLVSKRATQEERCVVGFVGDGINDAPALAAADVGIAIGSGSDVAISSAAFVLVSSNLKSLLVLCDLSRKVFRRVKLNFVWALIYNMVALPIAAGVVYPAGHARLDPVWASLAMALSSVSVVCSSLLLKLYKAPKLKF